MGRYKVIGWAKPYNRIYFVEESDSWNRELDFEGREGTIFKERRYIGWNNLEIFVFCGGEHSEIEAVEQDGWSHYDAHRALRMPNPVVYLYFTEAYLDGSASLLLVGRNVEAEYILLSLGAFGRAVQHGVFSRFALDQTVSTCAGRGALSRAPWELLGQRSRYGIFGIPMDTDVDPVLAILAITRAVEACSDVKQHLV